MDGSEFPKSRLFLERAQGAPGTALGPSSPRRSSPTAWTESRRAMLRRMAAASAGTLGLAYVASRSRSSPSHARQREEEPPEPCTDVLIIGGGIIGAAVAFQAAQQLGSRVTLLERESCGCEASGLSAGTMWCAGPIARVTKQNAIGHLRYGSTTLLEAIGGCEFYLCGGLYVAADES